MDLSAEIELHAATAEDLDRLAVVNNFAVDQDLNHIRILTTGTHDRKFMKAAVKNFPKNLFGLPWKIDYRIKVPRLIDVEINAGNGPLSVSGIEGAIRINALSSNANLSLTGGLVMATIQAGSVSFTIPSRGWHGLGAEIRLASGNINLELMPGFNADINAQVLRLGEIKNSYSELGNQAANSPQHSLQGRAGSGGATISLTVGDGVIEIKQAVVK